MAQSQTFDAAHAPLEATGGQEVVFPLLTLGVRTTRPANQWCIDESDELAERVGALRVALGGTTAATEPEEQAYDRECLAGVGGVCDALHALNLVILGDDLAPGGRAQASLMAYVAATYVWCGDVVTDLHHLAGRGGRGSRGGRTIDVARTATSYATEYLEPLFKQFNESCSLPSAEHSLDGVRATVERLQSEVVSLSWELGPDAPSEICEMPLSDLH
jgi:hypothetical protein